MAILHGKLNFRQLANRAKHDADRAARKITDPEGDIKPTVYLYRPDSQTLHVHEIPTRWFGSRESKDVLVQGLIRTLIELGGVTLVALQMTAYVTETSLDDLTDEQRDALDRLELPAGFVQPSQSPDRREAVLLVVFDAEIREGWFKPITRCAGRPPVYGVWRTEAAMIDGLIVNPIADALR
jgi:hypothetical protein